MGDDAASPVRREGTLDANGEERPGTASILVDVWRPTTAGDVEQTKVKHRLNEGQSLGLGDTMQSGFSVDVSVVSVDMDDDEVILKNMTRDLENIGIDLDWLLNDRMGDVLALDPEGETAAEKTAKNPVVKKITEMRAELQELVKERETLQQNRKRLKSDAQKIVRFQQFSLPNQQTTTLTRLGGVRAQDQDKEDIIFHGTRECVEGLGPEGPILRTRKVKVVQGTDGPEAEWMKMWSVGAAGKAVAGKSAGGWNAVLANAQKPKQDGMEVFGAKAAVIDLILEAYKKKGMGSKERKVMFASLLSLPMSQVWVRAREVSNDEELSEQLGEQDAERKRASSILTKTIKDKDAVIAGIESRLQAAMVVGEERVTSMEEQASLLEAQRDRICNMLGGAQDQLPRSIAQAHKMKRMIQVENRSQIGQLQRENDIEKNEKKIASEAAIQAVKDELELEADQRSASPFPCARSTCRRRRRLTVRVSGCATERGRSSRRRSRWRSVCRARWASRRSS